LSVFARQSTNFVVFQDPLSISSMYQPVYQAGLLHMVLCHNETLYSDNNNNSMPQVGCETIPVDQVTTTASSDVILSLSRLCVASSVVAGAFFTLFLSLSVVWEQINLKPIGFGLLLTYFLQSFSMMVFDTNICSLQRCAAGPGCYICIASSVCWFASCLVTARMDHQKATLWRQRRKLAHRSAPEAPEADAKGKNDSDVQKNNSLNETRRTTLSCESNSILESDEDFDPEEGI
jgi:hypothetical protein